MKLNDKMTKILTNVSRGLIYLAIVAAVVTCVLCIKNGLAVIEILATTLAIGLGVLVAGILVTGIVTAIVIIVKGVM